MTIKEIARLANVSSAAVSRYLNGGYISEEKRAQIKKVIEETGYHPSAQARTLRTKRASLIGVVVPKINSESISRVTEGIGNVLASRGYQMLLASTDNNAKKEIEYLHLFEKYPVDGIILIGTMITAEHRRFLKNAQVPVVVTGQYTKYANCIYHDDYGAGKAMGKLAASLSRRHVAYIGVTREDKAAGAAREDGFRAGLKSEGRELEDKYVRISAFRAESGYEAALTLLKA
jgi:LacI family sucrose operon transcriptional repressor